MTIKKDILWITQVEAKKTPYSRKDFTKERKKSVTSKNHQGRVEITNEVFKEMTYFKNLDIFTLKT